MGQHPRISQAESLSRRWRRFVTRVERQKVQLYREQLVPTLLPALRIYQGSAKPSRLLYFTKDDRCIDWIEAETFPPDWRALCRYGIPAAPYVDLLRTLIREAGCELWFVGDLDPHDLSTFATLRNGNAFLEGRPGEGLPVRYLGINDPWLQLCVEHLGPGFSLDGLSVQMGELEREHFGLVEEMLPDLLQLVGPTCLELLRRGRTLAFEAASSESFYKKGFGRKLLKHLGTSMAPARTEKADNPQSQPAQRRSTSPSSDRRETLTELPGKPLKRSGKDKSGIRHVDYRR